MAPSTAGTATIKATSVQDSSKSGSTAISVTSPTGVTISPTSAQVPVFNSQQFSATVNGNGSAAVTWAVNGVTGGNLTVGQIDGTGHYVAPNIVPSPATITVTATNQADTTQSASASVTILPDTSTLSIVSSSPASGQTGIGLDATIQIQFNEALAPATVNTSNFLISSGFGSTSSSVSYDPSSNTVTIIPAALLSPSTQYTVAVTTGVQDPAGTPLKSSAQWSFTTQSGTNVTGIVSVPTGTDPSTLTVVSYDGQESTPDSQGNFDASVTPVGTSLIAAMVPGKSFGWLATSGDFTQKPNASALQVVKRLLLASGQTLFGQRSVHITSYQITASPLAVTVSNGVGVDAETTAETLLFMSPYLHRSDPTSAAIIQAAIAADPNTGILATALQAASGEPDPLTDSTVQADLQTAIISITKTLNSSTTLQSLTSSTISKQLITKELIRTPSSLTTSSSQQSAIQATPNCWNWSTSVNHISPVPAGQLQCLDLDYVDLTPQTTPQNGNYTVNLDDNGCQNTVLGVSMGCDVDWLVLSGPLNPAMIPTGGVDAITPEQDSSGPGSPLKDFLSCASSNSSILSGTCNVALLPGKSTFSALNPIVGFTIIVDSDLKLPADSPPVTSFDVPAGSSDTYAVRAYSGGFADLDEYNAMWGGNYGDYSSQLWTTALILNIAHIVMSDNFTTLASTDNGPEVDKCVWGNLTSSEQIVNLENQVAHQQFDTIPDAISAASTDVNTLAGNYADAAIQCGKDETIASVWDMFTKTNGLLDAVNTALQGLSMIGDASQHLTELGFFASPIETGLVNESQPTQPTIMGVTLGSINADGSEPVTISGTGFEAGATLSWQTPGGSQQGPDIPSSVSANTIGLNKNFGSQAGTWEVQVTNPDGTVSGWKAFQVTSQSLLPAPTLLSPANGATGISTTPSFSWNPVSGATNYWLMVATSTSAFPTDPNTQSCAACIISQESLTGTSYTAPTPVLSGGQTYYWEVQAYTWSGGKVTQAGQYSAAWSFVTTSSNLPAPTLLSPANGAAGISATPSFSWTQVSGNAGYRILVATSSAALPTIASSDSCGSCVIDQTTATNLTSFTASAVLNVGTPYYWEVHALTPGTNSIYGTWSSVFSFTVAAATLSAPTLLTPANGAAGVTPTSTPFSWTTVTGATSGYNILVATSSAGLPQGTASASACTSCVFNSSTASGVTSWSPPTPLSSGTIYYWEVQGKSSSGAGSWPVPSSFTTLTLPVINSITPPTPTMSSSPQSITINGTGFQSGAQVSFTPTAGGTVWVTPSSISPTAIQVSPTLNQTGAWAVDVKNSDGGIATPYGFNVVAAAPSISYIYPTTMAASTTALTTLYVYGNNFSTSGGQLEFLDPNNIQYSSNSHPERVVTVIPTEWVYNLNNGGTTGTWHVRVVNADSQASSWVAFAVQ